MANTNTALNFAPVVSDNRRIDVASEDGETIISYSTWADGLGWCKQKTIPLNEALLDDLHKVITAARLKVKQNSTSGIRGDGNSANVLEFPKFD